MNNVALNYTAQARKAMAECPPGYWPKMYGDDVTHKDTYEAFLKCLDRAVPISLPENGVLLDGDKSLLDETPLAIPFPTVSYEYYYTHKDARHKCVTLATTEDSNNPDTLMLFDMLCTSKRGSEEGLPWMLVPYVSRVHLSEGLRWGNASVEVATLVPNDKRGAEAMKCLAVASNIIMEVAEALACTNVQLDTLQRAPKDSANAKRIRRGKAAILETKHLVISVPGRVDPTPVGRCGQGTGVNKRQHLRRGHIRRLTKPDGTKYQTWVQSTVVNRDLPNIIEKTYGLSV